MIRATVLMCLLMAGSGVMMGCGHEESEGEYHDRVVRDRVRVEDRPRVYEERPHEEYRHVEVHEEH